MQALNYYTLIGQLIGVTRRQLHSSTNNVRFKQENFVFADKRQICQQSRLSRIENGLVNRHYMDEIHYLIENLDRTPVEYDSILPIYDTFISEVFNATQYEFERLPHLKQRFIKEFKKYDNAFYTGELNRVLAYHFDLLINHHLISLRDFEAIKDQYQCFPLEMQLLFLNLAGVVMETFIAEMPSLEWYFHAVDKVKSTEPLAIALKAYTRLRRTQFLIAQREFDSLSKLSLSPYLKFRIARAQQSLAFESHSLIDFDSTVEPEIFNDSRINPFERARPYMTLGMMYYMQSNWAKSNQWYQVAISINPYIICIADVFIFDSLLRLNDTGMLLKLLNQSMSFLHLFPHFTSIKQSFFRSIIDRDHVFEFDHLFEHIKQLHVQDPTITIMRHYLMQYIKHTRQYKLLYMYDLAIEETRAFRVD